MTFTINGVMTLEAIAEEKRKIGAAVRLRVESGGSFEETRILAIQEDGTAHEVRHVERVEIACAPGEATRAIITVTGIDFDATARPELADNRAAVRGVNGEIIAYTDN